MAANGARYAYGMYTIIAGCGRLGSGVARALSEKGHDVVVVDEGAERGCLGSGFDGMVIDGSPVDEGVLDAAGMRKADLFVAATGDDRRNIMAVQMAVELFGVPKALARIADPDLERFYRDQGMSTVCPTSTGINQVIATIQETAIAPLDGTIDSNVVALVAPAAWVGSTMGKLSRPKGRRIIGLVSRDRVHGWEPGRIIRDGDSILLERGSAS